jgi:hypothetical protein
MRDKELKLQDVEASHTLGAAGARWYLKREVKWRRREVCEWEG